MDSNIILELLQNEVDSLQEKEDLALVNYHRIAGAKVNLLKLIKELISKKENSNNLEQCKTPLK